MCTTMRFDRLAEVDILLRTDLRNSRRTRTHGTIRQVPFRTSDLRFASHGRHVRHGQIESDKADARPAFDRDISETKNDDFESGTQKVSVFASRCQYRTAQSGLVDGHHLHRFGPRIHVSYGDYRLVQPDDFGVAIIELNGGELLHRLFGRGVRKFRGTGDFQQRSGCAVYLRKVFEQIRRSRNEKQHGRQGTMVGQRVHRTFLVDGEVRMRSLERLRNAVGIT